ncbi:MAG TPA: hypothetical protein VGK67_28810 [Myxococcales bacterium]|jgi:hypothetical protein
MKRIMLTAFCLLSGCGFQPVSAVLSSLSATERSALLAQTSNPTRGCTAKTLDDGFCEATSAWQSSATRDCAQQGQDASRLMFAGACGADFFKVVAYECCPPEPVTPCEGGSILFEGGKGSCKSAGLWTTYASFDCLGRAPAGLAFKRIIRFGIECEPDRYESVEYECCPGQPTDPVCPGGVNRKLGDPTSCKDEKMWDSDAADDCFRAGLYLQGMTYGEPCGEGLYRHAASVCCP